jgi:energy-coupling factor transport system permease protein
MIDARAWVFWASALAIAASATRNPLYLVVLLLVAATVERRCPRYGAGLLSPLRFAAFVLVSTTLLNGLTAHVGETTLVDLPGWLPLVGGPATFEAALFGLINGLVLAAVYASFAALNRAVPGRELVRLAPRALHEAGVVVAIALAFVPETTRSLARIREAQAIRGHRERGPRDFLPIAVPLVVGGLERSVGLAEAMVARGYGSVADRPFAPITAAASAFGLAALLLGWLAALFWPGAQTAGLGLVSIGALALVGGVWWAGRGVARSRYRSTSWGWREGAVVLGGVAALALLLVPLPFVDAAAAAYSPYPTASLPAFDPLAGLAPASATGTRMPRSRRCATCRCASATASWPC